MLLVLKTQLPVNYVATGLPLDFGRIQIQSVDPLLVKAEGDDPFIYIIEFWVVIH